ncbi:MAG: c-type cytochrome [Gammaproteobacteria bacterium]
MNKIALIAAATASLLLTASAGAAVTAANASSAAPAPTATAAASGPVTGNAAAGQKDATTCAACHGADGNSVSSQFPKLAGQGAPYIVEQLENFKSGKRVNAIMQPMAASLSRQQMADLAAWFSSQTIQPGEADPKLVKAGEALFRGGDATAGVPACAACHSPDGAGNEPMKIPQIGGQYADYIVAQLQAFAAGKRTASDPNGMMATIASRLTAAQMRAVASYIQGLHYAPIRK